MRSYEQHSLADSFRFSTNVIGCIAYRYCYAQCFFNGIINIKINKMINSNFEKRFAKRRKLFNVFFIFNLALIIAAIIGAIVLGYNVFTNPESVGEFFGRIMKGFNGVD